MSTNTAKDSKNFFTQGRIVFSILTLSHPVNSIGSRKNSWIACGFAREFLWSEKCYRPGQKRKRLGKSCCLHSIKKILVGECVFFVL